MGNDLKENIRIGKAAKKFDSITTPMSKEDDHFKVATKGHP